MHTRLFRFNCFSGKFCPFDLGVFSCVRPKLRFVGFFFHICSLSNYNVCHAMHYVYYDQIIWERVVFKLSNYNLHLIWIDIYMCESICINGVFFRAHLCRGQTYSTYTWDLSQISSFRTSQRVVNLLILTQKIIFIYMH